MLSKQLRLTKKEFTEAFKNNTRTQTQFFTVLHSKSDSPKFSVVVSKKIQKNAIERNKTRRRVYSVIRDLEIHTQSNGTYILLVKKPVLSLSYAMLKGEIEKTLI